MTTSKKPGGRKPAGASPWADLLGKPSAPTIERPELGPYTRYLEGKFAGDATGMQRAMLDALRGAEPLPDEMRADLAIAFDMLMHGERPDLFIPPGRHPVSLAAKAATCHAVRYVRLASELRAPNGEPLDSSPITTVAEAYGVQPRTVRNWIAEPGDIDLSLPFEDDLSRVVQGLMLAGAQAYRRFAIKRGPRK